MASRSARAARSLNTRRPSARAIERAVGRAARRAPKRRTTSASAGEPGATASRASTSASMTGDAERGEPRQAERLAGRDAAGQRGPQHGAVGTRRWHAGTPDHGCRQAASCRAAAVSVFLSSIAIVSGPTPPGTGVSAPALLEHGRVDVADHQRAAAREVREPLRPRREQRAAPRPRRSAGRCRRRSPSRPACTNSGVTNPGRPIAETRMSAVARPPADPASASGRSSPSRRAAAAASPSACRRSRCARSPPRACPRSRCRSRSSISITPDGVHGASSARPCTRRPTFTGLKPSTSLAGSIASNTCCAAPFPIAAGSGDWTRMPSCRSLALSRRTSASSSSSARRRRQPLEVHPEPGLGAGAHLVADVDLRPRILADEHDAEPRRPPRRRGEGVHVRQHRLADRRRDRLAVQHTCAHRAPFDSGASASAYASRLGLVGRRLQLAQVLRSAEHDQVISCLHGHVGRRVELHAAVGALDADHHDAEALAQVGLDDRPAGERRAGGDPHLLHVQVEIVGAGGQLDEVHHRRPQRGLGELQAADLIRRQHAVRARPHQLRLRIVGLGAADDEEVRAASAAR